jgi:uncharacterized protein (DUF4415 family)
MPKDFDPLQAAAHGYTQEDWDAVDSPELTDEELAAMRPMREAMPEVHAALVASRKRGPVRQKTLVSIRLDDDVLEGLRASGPGWQSRLNDAARMVIISEGVASAFAAVAQLKDSVPSAELANALKGAIGQLRIVGLDEAESRGAGAAKKSQTTP